jgi:hypothetical protein
VTRPVGVATPTQHDEVLERRQQFRAEMRAALGRAPRVLLISANPNVTTFVSPYGLEILAAALVAELDAEVHILDPFLPGTIDFALTAQILRFKPDVIGINFRNLDIAYVADIDSKKILSRSCVPTLRTVLARIRQAGFARTRILLGGGGFAAASADLLRAFDLPYGVIGPGAEAITRFVRAVVLQTSMDDVPGLVTAEDEGRPRRPADATWDNDLVPLCSVPHRTILRERNVFFPLRTSSGCGLRCSYCIEGRSQARKARARAAPRITEELELIQRQGASRVMLADGELNVLYSDVYEHALRLLAEAGLGWRAYCLSIKPAPELLRAMQRSRCEGILLTFDTAADSVLSQIGRPGTVASMVAALDSYAAAKLPVTVSLLFGLPGETDATVAQTLALIRSYPGVKFTYSCGARIYSNTPLAEHARRHPEHVYRDEQSDPLGVSLYSEPGPPWELAALLRGALRDTPNAERFW